MPYESYARASIDYDTTREPIGIPILLGCFALTERPLADLSILDAGCGTASYAMELAKWVKHVEGVDATPEMIEQGLKKIEIQGIPDNRLCLSEADIADLPFENCRFDGVMINQVLHHNDDDSSIGWPRHTAILTELGRVIRPGGVLVVSICSQNQIMEGWWYGSLFSNALERLRQRIIPIPTLIEVMESNGFEHHGNSVPIDAVFQGMSYFDPIGPLKESCRNGASFFALASNDELEAGCNQIRKMRDDGTLSQFVEQQDCLRQRIGQTTFVCFRKAK